LISPNHPKIDPKKHYDRKATYPMECSWANSLLPPFLKINEVVGIKQSVLKQIRMDGQ